MTPLDRWRNGDEIGSSLAVADDVLFAGAPGADPPYVCVYEQSAGEWAASHELTPSTAQDAPGFATVMDAGPGRLVVGAPGDYLSKGAVYVYEGGPDGWQLETVIRPDGGTAGMDFGYTVALSGDTLVTGARDGAIYVYVRDESGWRQQARLTAATSIGYTLDIDGDTLVAGSRDGGVVSGYGSVYTFVRNGEEWTQAEKMASPEPYSEGREFGDVLCLNGDTLLVSDGSYSGLAGAVYVYGRSEGHWVKEARLRGSSSIGMGNFGTSLRVDGGVITVGAPNDSTRGAVYRFEKLDGAWTETYKARCLDFGAEFGNALAAVRGAGVVGAPGLGGQGGVYFPLEAYPGNEDTRLTVAAPGVLRNDSDPDGDPLIAELHAPPRHGTVDLLPDGSFVYVPDLDWNGADEFSYRAFDGGLYSEPATVAVAIRPAVDVPEARPDIVDVDEDGTVSFSVMDNDRNPDARHARVYVTEQPAHGALQVTDSGEATYTPDPDWFGTDSFAYKLLDDVHAPKSPAQVTINVVPQDDPTVVVDDPDVMGALQMLVGPDTSERDFFGQALDIDGDTAVVGAPGDETGRGAAYVLRRSADGWSVAQKLTLPDGEEYDYFGYSCAVSGDTIAVGAPFEGSGAVHVFVLGEDGWQEQAELTSGDLVLADYFGYSIALEGERLVVGAPLDGVPQGTGQAYVYERTGDVWELKSVLKPSGDGVLHGSFGSAVALSGPVAVIGAPSASVSGGSNRTSAGRVFVFEHGASSWTQVASLTEGAPMWGRRFGDSVAVDGDVLAAGAFGGLSRYETSVGSVHIFGDSGTAWTLQKAHSAETTGTGYGFDVALDSGTLLVGEPVAGKGVVRMYERGGDRWSETGHSALPHQSTSIGLGGATDLDHGNILLGSINDSAKGHLAGAVYAPAPTYIAQEGVGLIVDAPGVLQNDVDLDQDQLVAQVVSGPLHGELDLLEDGSFTYTSDDEYSGPDTFTYRVFDGTSYTEPASVELTVMAVDEAPVCGSDDFETLEDEALTVAAPGVLANDLDPEAASLIATLAVGPSHGDIAFESDGSFIYTPDADFNGADTFTYRAFDGGLYSDPATVTITVVAVPLSEPVAGSSRYATAIEASKKAYPNGAPCVVIATGSNWPDALGGGALAAAKGGPILLTQTNAIPSEVLAEIKRLGATKAIVLGGEAAVGKQVFGALRTKLGSGNVTRIGGAGRYQTAEMIAKATVTALGASYDGTVFVATGNNFPDALGASPLAAAKGWPLLLSGPSGLNAGTLKTLDDIGATKVLLLGGKAVVPDTVKTQVSGRSPQRLQGAGRYGTARVVAQYGVDHAGLGWDKVAIATGENFPDALAGGVLQGLDGSVMLLTPGAYLHAEPQGALSANKADIHTVRFLGGESAVKPAARAQVQAVLD